MSIPQGLMENKKFRVNNRGENALVGTRDINPGEGSILAVLRDAKYSDYASEGGAGVLTFQELTVETGFPPKILTDILNNLIVDGLVSDKDFSGTIEDRDKFIKVSSSPSLGFSKVPTKGAAWSVDPLDDYIQKYRPSDDVLDAYRHTRR